MTSVPAFWGTPQRPTSVSSHPETSKAERYRNSKNKEEEQGPPLLVTLWGWPGLPATCFAQDCSRFCHWEINSQHSSCWCPADFTTFYLSAISICRLQPPKSLHALFHHCPSRAWDTHLLRLLWLHKRGHEPRCLQLLPTPLCILGAAFPALDLHTTSPILITSFYCHEHKRGKIP